MSTVHVRVGRQHRSTEHTGTDSSAIARFELVTRGLLGLYTACEVDAPRLCILAPKEVTRLAVDC